MVTEGCAMLQVPTLPFNAFGTMALARSEFETNSGSSQIFWLLKVPSLCPGYPLSGPACQHGLWQLAQDLTSPPGLQQRTDTGLVALHGLPCTLTPDPLTDGVAAVAGVGAHAYSLQPSGRPLRCVWLRGGE